MAGLPIAAVGPSAPVRTVRGLLAQRGAPHIRHGIDFGVREGEVVTLERKKHRFDERRAPESTMHR